MKNIRVGIVGIGNIGSLHVSRFLKNEVPGASLGGICDVSPAVRAKYPEVKSWADSEEFINSGEIDALIISTPHYSHTPIGISALKRGLHVLCEKPLCVHKADCQRLLAAHTNPKQVFGVMFDTRTEPRYIQLREMVRDGRLGRIRRINWTMTNWFRSNAYYASSDWRATWAGEGGGMLVNQLPHDLDLLQWIFGLPRRVRAFCPLGKYHPIEVEDEVNAILEYEDGATAVLVATTGEAPGVDRREVVGDNGRVIVHDDRLEFIRNLTSTAEFCRTTPASFGRPESEEIVIPVAGKAGRHLDVIRAFVSAIHEGTPLIARAEEGVASCELANAITLSSAQDRSVSLPLDAEAYERFLTEKRATSRPPTGRTAQAGAVVDMSASFNH